MASLQRFFWDYRIDEQKMEERTLSGIGFTYSRQIPERIWCRLNTFSASEEGLRCICGEMVGASLVTIRYQDIKSYSWDDGILLAFE